MYPFSLSDTCPQMHRHVNAFLPPPLHTHTYTQGNELKKLYNYYYLQRFRVQFPALPDFLRNSGSGTGSTQPREDN
jgi:hypothetical protein